MRTENLISRMSHGEFPIVVQLHPPKPDRLKQFCDTVDQLEKCGITIFDVNASPEAERLDSFTVATKISGGNRIVMPHATARNKLEDTLKQSNQAYEMHKINHILVVKGDQPKEGDFQTDVETLIASLAALKTTDSEKRFVIAAGANHNAKDLETERKRLCVMKKRGADIFMSQLVLDTDQAKKLQTFSDIPLLAGISALKKINPNMKGIVMPKKMLEEERKIGDNTKLLYEKKLERAVDIVGLIRDKSLAQGIYIAAPVTLNEEGSMQIVHFAKTLSNI